MREIRKIRIAAIVMSEVWNKVYKSDHDFFGKEPSNLALPCLNHMKKTNNAKKVLLELGAQVMVEIQGSAT